MLLAGSVKGEKSKPNHIQEKERGLAEVGTRPLLVVPLQKHDRRLPLPKVDLGEEGILCMDVFEVCITQGNGSIGIW